MPLDEHATGVAGGSPAGRRLVVVGLVALGLVVVAAASLMPPMVVEPRATVIALRPIEFELPSLDIGFGDLEPPEFREATWEMSWLRSVPLVLAVIAGLVVLIWIIRRWLASGHGALHAPSAGTDGDVLLSDQPQLAPVVDAVDAALRHLEGDAATDDAVIAAWLALESAAARAGVARKPADTPTEFTLMILARLQADPASAHGLLGLYHRARFAQAPLAAVERHEARRHRQRLASDWQ